MSGRFPRSPDLDAFWRNLEAGVDLTGPLPPARLAWQPGVTPDASVALRGGFLDLVRVWVSALRPRDWKLLRGCNFVVSREAFMAVNGFDEQFEGWGYEDSDLCIRLMNHGLAIRRAPAAACVLHLWHREHDRQFEGENMARLQATLRSGRTLPARGITPPAST